MRDDPDFSQQERSAIFDFVLTCVECDHRFDAVDTVLGRIATILGSASIGVFQFRQPVSSSNLLIGAGIGTPVDMIGLHAVLPRWQSYQVPVRIPVSRGGRNYDQQTTPWLVHGHCGAFGTTTVVCFESRSPRARHSALLRLIAFHMHELLSRALVAKKQGSHVFTSAEREIIHHLLAGKSNKQIAGTLGKSEATVRNQLHSIFLKLQVKRRLEAIRKLENSASRSVA